jgi:hypothetical protein
VFWGPGCIIKRCEFVFNKGVQIGANSMFTPKFMYSYMRVRKCKNSCMHAFMILYMCVLFACLRACLHVCMNACMYACSYACVVAC